MRCRASPADPPEAHASADPSPRSGNEGRAVRARRHGCAARNGGGARKASRPRAPVLGRGSVQPRRSRASGTDSPRQRSHRRRTRPRGGSRASLPERRVWRRGRRSRGLLLIAFPALLVEDLEDLLKVFTETSGSVPFAVIAGSDVRPPRPAGEDLELLTGEYVLACAECRVGEVQLVVLLAEIFPMVARGEGLAGLRRDGCGAGALSGRPQGLLRLRRGVVDLARELLEALEASTPLAPVVAGRAPLLVADCGGPAVSRGRAASRAHGARRPPCSRCPSGPAALRLRTFACVGPVAPPRDRRSDRPRSLLAGGSDGATALAQNDAAPARRPGRESSVSRSSRPTRRRSHSTPRGRPRIGT